MYSQDLESADLIRHANVDLSIETAESSEGGIEGVGSVRSSDNYHMSTTLQAVHKCEHL